MIILINLVLNDNVKELEGIDVEELNIDTSDNIEDQYFKVKKMNQMIYLILVH